MSSIALDRFPAARPLRPSRHLRLVPTPVPSDGSHPEALRLTRRGRLAITVSVTLAVVATLVTVALLIVPASASSEVTVQPGQTLSEIAATHLPHLPLDRAIVAVQQENQMNTLHLQAGQTVVIP